jgi:hypothetical protein
MFGHSSEQVLAVLWPPINFVLIHMPNIDYLGPGNGGPVFGLGEYDLVDTHLRTRYGRVRHHFDVWDAGDNIGLAF